MLSKVEIENLLTEIEKELQKPLWDAITVENDLKVIRHTLLCHAKEIQNNDASISFEEAKIVAANVLDRSIMRRQPVVEFFIENKEFGILKRYAHEAFSRYSELCLNRLKAMCEYGGDDYLYFDLIESVHSLFKFMNAEEEAHFQRTLDPLLASADLSFSLLLGLLPFTSPSMQQSWAAQSKIAWRRDFSKGLQIGDLGLVHDALFLIAHRPFLALIKNELFLGEETAPYAEALTSIQSIDSIGPCLESIVRRNFIERRDELVKKPIAKDSPVSMLLKSSDDDHEMGSSLGKLHLIEQALQNPGNPEILSAIDLVLAMESGNLEAVDKFFTEGKVSFLKQIATGETPVAIAARLAVLGQKATQEKLEGENFIHASMDFFLAFHELSRDKLPREAWTDVISLFSETAFKSNGVFIGKKTPLFFGKWDDPEIIYSRLLKIYLPEEDRRLWAKYCVNPNTGGLEELMADAYQGGAETYGLWFRLMHKATLEKMNEGCGLRTILLDLGHYRRLVGLFINSIQVPREKKITLASRIIQEGIDKIWPGSPLNFGIPDTELHASHTTMLNEIRSHYLRKTAALIFNFNQAYASELQELKSGESHFGKVGRFDYDGKEITVYPYGDDFCYAIAFPFKIGKETITGVHIVWGWPSTTFYYSGHMPKKIPDITIKFNPIWVHPSGRDKRKIIEETDRLFGLLVAREYDEKEFEHNLARFIYLYFQTLYYKRGSASIGAVLLSALLEFRGLKVPDAPAAPFFLDCEAMCTTEEEFTREFICRLLI